MVRLTKATGVSLLFSRFDMLCGAKEHFSSDIRPAYGGSPPFRGWAALAAHQDAGGFLEEHIQGRLKSRRFRL